MTERRWEEWNEGEEYGGRNLRADELREEDRGRMDGV